MTNSGESIGLFSQYASNFPFGRWNPKAYYLRILLQSSFCVAGKRVSSNHSLDPALEFFHPLSAAFGARHIVGIDHSGRLHSQPHFPLGVTGPYDSIKQQQVGAIFFGDSSGLERVVEALYPIRVRNDSHATVTGTP
jgi:hypothetical protein